MVKHQPANLGLSPKSLPDIEDREKTTVMKLPKNVQRTILSSKTATYTQTEPKNTNSIDNTPSTSKTTSKKQITNTTEPIPTNNKFEILNTINDEEENTDKDEVSNTKRPPPNLCRNEHNKCIHNKENNWPSFQRNHNEVFEW